MPPAGFEPTVPAIELLHTNALDRAATGIGRLYHIYANLLSQNTRAFRNRVDNAVLCHAISCVSLKANPVFRIF